MVATNVKTHRSAFCHGRSKDFSLLRCCKGILCPTGQQVQPKTKENKLGYEVQIMEQKFLQN